MQCSYSGRIISSSETTNPETNVRYILITKPLARDWAEFDNATRGKKKVGLRSGDIVDAKAYEDVVKQFEGKQGFDFPTIYEQRQKMHEAFNSTVGTRQGFCWNCGQRASYQVLADDEVMADANVCSDCHKQHVNLGVEMVDLDKVHKQVLAVELATALKQVTDLCPGSKGDDHKGLNPEARCAFSGENMVTELDAKWDIADFDPQFYAMLQQAYGSEDVPSLLGAYLGNTWKAKFDKAGFSPLFLGGWEKSALIGKLRWAHKTKGLKDLSAEALKSFCRITGRPIAPGEAYMVLGKSFGEFAGGKLSMSACVRYVFPRGFSDQLDDVHRPSKEAAKHSAQKARQLMTGTADRTQQMALTSSTTTKGKASSGRKSGRHGR